MWAMMPGIVLAAGASSRMGRPKALLRIGDRTFVRAVLDALRDGGLTEAVVVVRPGQAAVQDEVVRAAFGRCVENEHPERGQWSSLVAGLDAIDTPGVSAVLVTLVDIPLIGGSTVRRLVERAAASPAPILRAVHRGQHGHPVVFTRAVFDELRRADPSQGAKQVVRAHHVEDVEVDDPGVSRDIDTPEDYERVRAQQP
jgi:molybdenum cofactor cytidylyltransferase